MQSLCSTDQDDYSLPHRACGLSFTGVIAPSTTIPAGLSVADTSVDLLVVGSGTGMAAALAAA